MTWTVRKRIRPPRLPDLSQVEHALLMRSFAYRCDWRGPAYRRLMMLCAILRGLCVEIQRYREVLAPFTAEHVRAVLSREWEVWKVCRDGLGFVRAALWRLKLAAWVREMLPPLDWRPWVRAVVMVALFAAQLYDWTHPTAGVFAAALSATCIHEVESGGSDANNSGIYDPGVVSAGGFTDGAATSATGNSPVFTSASYNFVAGDVGAWVFIVAGTNWTKGWYKIASVAANAATLSAAVGAAVSSSGATTSPIVPNTVAGCATTASPTGATWSIDYSQQTTPKFTYTDLASVGAGLLVSSVAKPFAKEQVGNSIVITSGTNFTAGRYVIASVAAGVATVQGAANITTGAGVSGVGSQGGAYASPGLTGAHMVAGNQLFVQTGTYTVTSATINIAAGCWAPTVSSPMYDGYATVRGDLLPLAAAGTRPTIVAGNTISTFTLCSPSGGGAGIRNVILDGTAYTSSRGINTNGTSCYNVHGKNMTNSVFGATRVDTFRCSATTCATAAPFISTGNSAMSVAYANTVTGFGLGATCSMTFCLSVNNSGASSDGFSGANVSGWATNCTTYGNGRDGFRFSAASCQYLINCIGESNTGVAATVTSATGLTLVNLASYSNTGGLPALAGVHIVNVGQITGTASFFINAAGGDFSLNTTAGGGALLRAAGYPGVMPYGGTGYLDVGALQHADPAVVAAAKPNIFESSIIRAAGVGA